MLCDSKTCYILNIKIYIGGNSGNFYNSVVCLMDRLYKNYFGKAHAIYMDHLYTSVPLFGMLWDKNTLTMGTLMKHRWHLPQELLQQTLQRGQFSFRCISNLFFMKWKDKRILFMLSNKTVDEGFSYNSKSQRCALQSGKTDIILDYNVNRTAVILSQYYFFFGKAGFCLLNKVLQFFCFLLRTDILNSWTRLLCAVCDFSSFSQNFVLEY